MYIKKIKICGFRTYKNETIIDFTRGINCIVGFNGSGKSNILLALEFILSDVSEYKTMYLHEGIGQICKSAYVEVVFDNTEKYFNMFQEDDIVVRKVLDNGRCDIFVNEKPVSKYHYVEMLESCGLCINNLYNIIKQGHVIKLSNMKEDDVLYYMKNILGAKLFEEKKKDALAMLKECDAGKTLTEKDFEELYERIEHLKKESERYLIYEKLENERIQLEHLLTQMNYKRLMKDSQKAKKKMSILNKEAETEDAVLNNYLDKKSDLMEEINKLKLEILTFKNELDVQISEEIQNERNMVHVQIMLEEKKAEKKTAEAEDKRRFAERQEINEFISVVNEKIDLFKRAISTKETTMKNKKEEIDKLLATSKKKDTNEEEYVNNVKKIESMLKDINGEISSVDHEIRKSLQLLERLETVYNNLLAESKQNTALSEICDNRINDLTGKIEECVEKKRQEQQNISMLTSRMNAVKGQLIEAKEKYEEMLKSTQKEIRRLIEIIFEEPSINNDKVIGLLIDNIQIEKTYIVAADAVLCHYYFILLVEDMQTVKSIISFVEKKRNEKQEDNESDDFRPAYYRDFIYGKLVIVPIDRVKKYDEFKYPNDENIIPLIKCIKCDDRISNYMKNILYKTIVVKSLNSCEAYYEDEYTCVDLDGDYMSGKGYVYGGYTKRKHSIYEVYSKVKELKEEEENIKKKIEECYDNIEKIENEIRENYDKKAIVLAQKNGCDTRLGSLENTGKSNEEYIRVSSIKLTGLKAKKKSLEEYKEKLLDQIKLLREQSSDPDKPLATVVNETHKEEESLNSLTDEVKKLKDEIAHLQHKQDEYKDKLELLYNKKIEADSYIFFTDTGETNIEEYTKELKKKESLRDAILQKKKNIEEKIEEATKEKERLKREVDKLLVAEKKQKKKILDLCHQINILNAEIRVFDNKEADLKEKRAMLEKNTTNSEEFKHLSEAHLSAKLKAVTTELKKYLNVNSKAGKKLHQVIADFEDLKKRDTDIKKSYTTIKNMIQEIEKKKDESLEHNFMKINKSFSEFFSMLFKNKKAHLVLNKMSEEEYNEQMKKREKSRRLHRYDAYIDKVTGISIRIIATGDEKSVYTIQELSGGERSIVAICLLLCLNQIDNCSFFFFDEVDAALDTVHRDNLSILLKELSERGTQFIVTTFRKELLEYCNNLYIIKLINRESCIAKGTKDEAYDIITEEEKKSVV